MKKFLILAALLGGVSFASTAAAVSTTTTAAVAVHSVNGAYVLNPNKVFLPDYRYHFTSCGVDTWAWGATEDEMWEVVGVLVDAYC